MKRGDRIQFCPAQHDTTVVGRNKNRHCNECRRLLLNKWRQSNSFNARAQNREGNWRKTGIKNQDGLLFTLEDFDRTYQIQQGRCANKACNRHQSELKGAFCADHDHKTSVFRGLLCRSCNITIGMAREDIHILKGLIEYLERSE